MSMSRIPRCTDGRLDSSAINKIHVVLDREGFFPEVVVAYTKDIPIIQPVTKKLLDEIVLSGIEYDERKKST
jgi:hypothetical protein